MTGLCPRAAGCALMLFVVSGSPAWAGAPTEALRHSFDRIFALLDDPAFKGGDRAVERQRELFALADLIAHAYLKLIPHHGVRIAYDEEIWTGKDVIVRARTFGKTGDATPVSFAMREGGDGQWRVFDVSFAGMSLVGTYHAQFMRVIRTGSYEELVNRLETKAGTDTDGMQRSAP